MTADATIAAARDVLDGSLAELRTTADGCTADELNERPAGGDTNPIAVLVTHALHSTRAWLSVAVGAAQPERDRPSEFRVVVDDPSAFMAWIDAMADDCRAILATDEPFDPAMDGVPTWRFDEHDDTEPEPVTAAWALLHALAHLREHVGHAQLTRDVVGRVP